MGRAAHGSESLPQQTRWSSAPFSPQHVNETTPSHQNITKSCLFITILSVKREEAIVGAQAPSSAHVGDAIRPRCPWKEGNLFRREGERMTS